MGHAPPERILSRHASLSGLDQIRVLWRRPQHAPARPLRKAAAPLRGAPPCFARHNREYHAGMGTQTTVPLEDIDLSSIEFWLAGSDYREAAFATLRQAAPVRFFEEAEF